MLPKLNNFIGGKFTEPVGGEYLEKYDPRTGLKMQEVAGSGQPDVKMSVEAASGALDSW